MNPNNLSVHELIHYGDQHSDPWVNRLANVLYALSFHLPGEDLDNIDHWFEKNEQEIKDLEWSVEDAVSSTDEVQRELDNAERTIRTMKFDLEERYKLPYEESQINILKAQVVELAERLDTEKKNYLTLRKDYNDLETAHERLKDKYNTWQIIAR